MSMTNISPHTSGEFNAAMDRLRHLILKVGGIAEDHVAASAKVLDSRDTETAKKVIGSDYRINAMELKVDEECAGIMALRQPVARDLRTVIVALKVITDIERIGDEAQKIAKQVLAMGQVEIPVEMQRELNELGKIVIGMLRKSLDGFARTEPDMLNELQEKDKEVDSRCNMVMNEFKEAVVARPADVDLLLNAVRCARSLERIGDHACNIGEQVVYLAEGKDIRHADAVEEAGIKAAPVS